MEFKLRYKYDGGQTCRPIGATVDSAATPVQLPVATDATIRIEMVSAWSRRVVRPAEDIHGATAWRFAVFDKYGDGMGMLFATRNVDVAESYWKVPWKDSGTKEMFAALGGEPARVFTAELQGYETQDSALPTAVFSFPVRVGNRRGDIVDISPLEQFVERDPVALAALDKHAADNENPHGVTAGQVGADPAGTAAKAVGAHNTSETAHADIRSAVSTAQSAADGAIEAVQSVAGDLSTHATNTDNPHSVTELQVSTATTERANRSFIRADYNYAGRPNYIDAKVTDLILFEAFTRVSNLFVNAKLQSTYVTAWGNANGHLILEGAGANTYGLTLRTVGETNNKPGIDINPASSTTIKGDLNIASRAAVTTGSWQKTASAGDLTADGTITAKTGMKVTHTDGEATTDVMSVDSTGMKVSATSVTEEGTTTGSMSVGSTGMKVSIGDGETTKDVVSVDSTGLTVDGKTTSTSVVSNSVSTNGLRVYTTGTDASKQYIDLYAGVIKGVHSANLTIFGNNAGISHNIVIGSQNYPISLRKGNTNLLVISTSGATLSVPFTARIGATILNGITTDRAIDFTEVSTDLLNEFDIWTFGKPSYIMNVGSCNGQTITFNAPYIYNQGQLDIPSVSRSSVYMFYNETSNDIVVSFELTEMEDDASDGVVFLYNDKANFFQRTIRQGCFVAVRVSIMNTDTNISGKRAYLVCAEDMGHFQNLP